MKDPMRRQQYDYEVSERCYQEDDNRVARLQSVACACGINGGQDMYDYPNIVMVCTCAINGDRELRTGCSRLPYVASMDREIDAMEEEELCFV